MARTWYEMKAADSKAAEILIYGEIGKSWWDDDAVSAKQFVDDLAALGDIDKLTVRINSPGGDAFDGIAIHNAIKNHKAESVALVDGIAASAASIIAMGADKVTMAKNSFMLIHGASGFSWGNADDMRAIADDLDRLDKSIVTTYATRSKQTQAKIKAVMKEDRLMDADEAKQLGLADEITDEIKAVNLADFKTLVGAKYTLRLLPKNAAKQFVAAHPETETEPDPPPATVSEGLEALPEAPPAPTSRAGDNVVTLAAARKEGSDEHKAYTDQVADLCTLAGMPELAVAMIKSGKTIDAVRKELIEAKAKRDGEVPPVMPQHPSHQQSQQVQTTKLWDKIAQKLNARVK